MRSLILLLALLVAAAHQSPSSTEPLAGKVVVIDPGHNGGNATASAEIQHEVPAGGFKKPCNTTGTATDDGSLTEAELNFAMARKVKRLLESAGARVVLTRPDNRGVGPCVDRRARVGNRARADVVLSIHADGDEPGETGYHVIRPGTVRGYNDGIQAESDDFATNLRDELDANSVGRSTYIGDGTGLDRRTDLAGLNLSRVPVAMVELGNMRSPRDSGLMKSESWRRETSGQLAAAVEAFLADR